MVNFVPSATPNLPAATTEVGESSHAAEGMVSGSKSPDFNGTIESIRKKIELEIQDSELKQQPELKTEEEKDMVAHKIEEGELPPMRRRWISLGYVAPILKQGKPTAQLCRDEIASETAKWKNAVILYVIGESPTLNYLRNFLQNQCEILGQMEVFYHNEGFFLVCFKDKKDKEKLLYEGPYTIASRPVIVKEWSADFCFEKEVLKEIPLWIRLPNLPLTCWSPDSLSHIGSVLGRPICADECTSQQTHISYARLLIEVDITQPLVHKVQIEGGNGVMAKQQVLYEWVPMFCPKCHKVGTFVEKRKGQ